MAFVIPVIKINSNMFMKESTLYILHEKEKYRVIVLNH